MEARGGPVEAVQHAAVRGEGDLPARMARGERTGGGDAARVEGAQRLAALCGEFRVTLSPAQRLLGPSRLDLGEGEALEGTERAFPKPVVEDDLDAGIAGECLCGFARTPEVARVDRGELLPGDRCGEAARLPPAVVVERDVDVALNTGVHVPGRLAVPDREDAGRFQRESARQAPVQRVGA